MPKHELSCNVQFLNAQTSSLSKK